MKPALRHALINLLVWSVVVSALALVALSATRLSEFPTIAGLCVLVVVGSALNLPHGSLNVALASLVLVSVYLVVGPAAAIVIAFIGSLLLLRRPVPLVRRIFSIATRVLSAAGGALAFVAVDGPVGRDVFDHVPRALLAVTVTVLAHQVVNASLMCLHMGLEQGAGPVKAFLKDVVRPTALPMLGYSYLGFMLAVMWLGGLNVVAGLLVLVPFVVARWALAQDEAEQKAQAATMRAFVEVIETKDPYTRGHCGRVSEGVGMLGRELQLPQDRVKAVEHAGLLHDVGKVGVPTSVIRKPGKLDDDEWSTIKLHPARGVELIGNIPFLEEVKAAVLHHHEKYDGSGYPAGLKGRNIPYFSRMICIVDAFDCLTTTRSYRPARSVEETLQILEQDKYTHFDPDLVDAFVAVVRKEGWTPAAADQPAPDASVEVHVDHDDLSLGSGGGATGNAVGPT
jgi:HD domain